MKVAICEDNAVFAKQLECYINNYAFIEENSIQIALNTTSPRELETFIEKNNVDCFYLDIDLGLDITGLDLAKIIRKKQPLASIIFITTHNEMLHLTFKYQVEALDFIIKDEENDLHLATIESLKAAFNKYKNIGEHPNTHYYQIKIGEYVKNIELDDILYFTVSDVAHKVILTTTQGLFEFYQSLNEIEKDFDELFFRCHRSYLINLNNVKEAHWKSKIVVMQNGDNCPLSYRKVKRLKEILG
ncbi:LytR/AlgR family response regulator transcription factor [Lysinibacillus sp. RS5]|uniref:LytR/AlgR family response regulator transcription factor n=1 Tax=unclassified Lysinibacillus TaxID=2636778 RepID=UPI0035BE311E